MGYDVPMERYRGVVRIDENHPIQMTVSDREQSHLLVYRDLSDDGKDRVDNYTAKIRALEQQDSNSEITEQFQKRFVARNGKKISRRIR